MKIKQFANIVQVFDENGKQLHAWKLPDKESAIRYKEKIKISLNIKEEVK